MLFFKFVLNGWLFQSFVMVLEATVQLFIPSLLEEIKIISWFDVSFWLPS
uniref:Uncharacterized protein n=1 Tax=Anguilla anguilla TaxID=7936 RepID=A0A0E9S3V4_ANGAN